MCPSTKRPADDTAVAQYRNVRRSTGKLCETLEPEDYVVQSMPDASPAKWHLAHTSWFFERFLLAEYRPGYRRFDERFDYLFNSYYYIRMGGRRGERAGVRQSHGIGLLAPGRGRSRRAPVLRRLLGMDRERLRTLSRLQAAGRAARRVQRQVHVPSDDGSRRFLRDRARPHPRELSQFFYPDARWQFLGIRLAG